MVLALDAENETPHVAMQTLKEMIFGKRSERFAVIVAAQLALELGDLETDATTLPAPTKYAAAAAKPSDKPRNEARRNIGALPKHLPRCDQVLEPAATACPCCQGQLHKIGEDVREVLESCGCCGLCPKYACRGCTDRVVQAKVLPRLVEGGMYRRLSWLTWWSRSSPDICRCIAKRRSWLARAFISTARRSPAG